MSDGPIYSILTGKCGPGGPGTTVIVSGAAIPDANGSYIYYDEYSYSGDNMGYTLNKTASGWAIFGPDEPLYFSYDPCSTVPLTGWSGGITVTVV